MFKNAKLCLLVAGSFLGCASAMLAQDKGTSGLVPAVQSSLAAEAESAALPNPLPAPVHHDTERGEINLALGFSYLRFRSSQFNANTFGTTTDFTYFLKPWMGVEGNVSTGFGSQSSNSAEAKSCLYGGGVRVIAPHERRLRPRGHALLGGVCMYPQTAFNRHGFATQLGGGADIRLHSWWLWLCVEGNYMRSQLYGQGENNVQISTSVVYRF